MSERVSMVCLLWGSAQLATSYHTFKVHSPFTAGPFQCLFLFVITVVVCGVFMMCRARSQALPYFLTVSSQ